MGTFMVLNRLRLFLDTSRGALRRWGAAAAMMAIVLALPSITIAATVEFRIDRTSADPEERTFSGSGLVAFEGVADDPADIDLLSLQISTIGGVFVGSVLTPVTHLFTYNASDIVSVSGLAAVGTGLAGSISFDGKDSADGEVRMIDLVLDFDSGTASGFCFSNDEQQCIFGGGSSSAVDAVVSTAPIPLPASLPLLALALGALAVRVSRRRRQSSPT